MLKLIPIALVALVSCSSPTSTGGSSGPAPGPVITPSNLQAGVLKACGYYETLGPLAEIIASAVPIPGVSLVENLISAICQAELANASRPPVRAANGRMMAAPPQPATVIINGKPVVLVGGKKVQ